MNYHSDKSPPELDEVNPLDQAGGDDDELLSTDAAGIVLGGIASSTMCKWRVAGSGPPFVKLGRLVKYRRGDLRAHSRARRRRSTSDPGEV